MPTSSFLLFISWWVLLSGAATAVLIGLDRVARRLLPLAALLNLSLVFPDEAPSGSAAQCARTPSRHWSSASIEPSTLGEESPLVDAAEQLLALVAELDTHDRLTRGHSERVRAYAQMIGKELHLKPDELDALNWAALVHDVGKLKVPAEILEQSPGSCRRRSGSWCGATPGSARSWSPPWRAGSESGRRRCGSTTSAGTASATRPALRRRDLARRADRRRRRRVRRDHVGTLLQALLLRQRPRATRSPTARERSSILESCVRSSTSRSAACGW